jgi:hypothetical protein
MKAAERTQAALLRQEGLTYREILRHVPVSKSSLSVWLRDIVLTEAQKVRSHGKNMQIRRRLVEYNGFKRQAALTQHQFWQEMAKAEVGSISPEILKWIGVALYWGEGAKSSGRGGLVNFCNSDPEMIRLMMRWFREICQVPEEKFRVRVQIHPGQSVDEAEPVSSDHDQDQHLEQAQTRKHPASRCSSNSNRRRQTFPLRLRLDTRSFGAIV